MAGVPALVGLWALAGLYLSLGPSLAIALLSTESRVAGGALILALAGAGAVASIAVHSVEPRLVLIRGSIVLICGVAITLVGVASGSIVLLYAGTIVAGFGFGPAFSAFVGSTAPLVPTHQRGGLVAAIYIVVYLAISVPAIAGGAGVTVFGLRDTTVAYGVVVIALAAATTWAVSRRLAKANGVGP